ncbi:MAG TPA: c-type cytochrome [Stellaceae bacterium]|nr:c-type cytochrome [Stellaceae bacterium]
MDAIDRSWRLSILAILAGMLLTIGVLAFVVAPLVNNTTPGLSAFTVICRAIGLPVGKAPTAQTARAVPASQVAWTAPQFAVLAHADVSAGANLAQATCVACHAADGTSADPSIPRLAGQSAFAIYKQLEDFKSGARGNEVMTQVVAALEPKQMGDLAAYYAGLTRHDLDAAHPSFAGPEIESLVLRGDAQRALPPCAACHSAGSGGPIETPSLTGQNADYVAAQLKAFADGGRHNDVFRRMRAIAAKLSAHEMALLGAYYTTPH